MRKKMTAHSAIIFDTLQCSKRLREAGFTQKQAEIQAEVIAEIVEDKLATKRDLEELRIALKRDIESLRTELKRDIKELEYRMIVKIGSMFGIGITALVLLMKIFHI